MRRSVLALIGTVAGTALMVGAKLGTHPGTGPDPAALDTAPSGEPSSAPATSAAPSSAAPKPGSTRTAPPAAGGLRTGTFTGAGTAAKQYETVTVRITVADGKITAVNGSCGNASGQSKSICGGAMPRLQQETLAAQNAKIATVSGATYTSNAYKTSLQSALDRAKA